MAGMNIGSDAALQEFEASRVTGVTNVMMQGGSVPGRLFRGGKEALKIKMKSPWRGKDNIEQAGGWKAASAALRLMGKTKQAEWVDRLTGTKIKKEVKDTEKKAGTAKMQQVMNTQMGMLVRIDQKVSAVQGMVSAQGEVLNNIRTMLAPREFAVGKGDQQQRMTFNPLAPKGSEFNALGEDGKLSKKELTEEIAEKAAKAVTKLQMKEEERRGKRAMLMMKKSRQIGQPYSDPAEGASPIEVLRAEMNANFAKLFDQQEEDAEKNEGWLSQMIAVGKSGGLKLLGMLGKIGLVGLALKIGWELGKWLNEKFNLSQKINDAIFAVQDWFAALDIPGKFAAVKDWFVEMKNSVVDTVVGIKDSIMDKFYEIKDWFEQMMIDIKVWIYDIIPGHSDDETEAYRRELQAGLDKKRKARADEKKARERRKQEEAYTAKLGETESLASLQQQYADLDEAIKTAEDPKFRDFLIKQRSMTMQAMEKRAPGSSAVHRSQMSTGTIERKDLHMPDQTIQDVIVKAAKKVGVDQGLMMAMARQESGFRPNADAKTSSAKGLYQFIDKTWGAMVDKYADKYPELNKGPYDPEASATAGALFIKENADVLKKAGIALTASNLYTAHFLGPGGARQLLSASSDAIAADMLPAAAKANKGIFYDKHGRARTVGEVEALMYDKIGKYADAYTAALGPGASKDTVMVGTPGQRISGAAVDSDSRTVQQGQRGGGAAVVNAPVVVNNTNPTAAPKPQVGAPKADPATTDPSLSGSAYRDQSMPMPA